MIQNDCERSSANFLNEIRAALLQSRTKIRPLWLNMFVLHTTSNSSPAFSLAFDSSSRACSNAPPCAAMVTHVLYVMMSGATPSCYFWVRHCVEFAPIGRSSRQKFGWDRNVEATEDSAIKMALTYISRKPPCFCRVKRQYSWLRTDVIHQRITTNLACPQATTVSHAVPAQPCFSTCQCRLSEIVYKPDTFF